LKFRFPNNIISFIILTIILHTSVSVGQQSNSFNDGLLFLSKYIASQEYSELNKSRTDLERVDILFEKAKSYFNNDVSEALLCLTFSTLPFNKIDFVLPFGLGIMKIPLPSPSQKIFKERLKNLPSRLFLDSPKNEFGDKDKLAHFFGNSFLHYNISVFNFSKFMGIFVEETEQNFFANGGLDRRDLLTNHLGELFAEMLKNNFESKPSQAILVYQLLFFRVNP
jgi:hypothetical protein